VRDQPTIRPVTSIRFKTLAHKLADAGIVSLRFDKRGTGYNADKGSFAAQTFNDYYDDAKDALELLKTNPSVNTEHVILIGHSIGTYIAARLAQEFDVSDLILVSGPDTGILARHGGATKIPFGLSTQR